MSYVAGLDIGSTTTKLVILVKEKIKGHYVIQTGANSRKACQRILEMGLKDLGLKQDDIQSFVSTGYGRHNIGFGRPISEITCQARGVKQLFPEADLIIDIGGQDFKVIKLNQDGKVSNFAMNDKCAAGTGRYLELMAAIFNMNLDEFSDNADFGKGGASITSVCTVFAETEVINHITKGTDEKEIVAGIFMAVSRRVFSLARRLIEDASTLVFTGGVAKNRGMKTALAYVTKGHILVPSEPQITAALGGALFAGENIKE
jgi:predicted CoA-substrate-specific enzyme activase